MGALVEYKDRSITSHYKKKSQKTSEFSFKRTVQRQAEIYSITPERAMSYVSTLPIEFKQEK